VARHRAPRRKAQHPLRQASTYPINSLLTARVACIAAEEGWCQAFTEGVYSLHWTRNVLIGSIANIRTVLAELGKEPDALVEQAQSSATKEALKQHTERARSLGIFGAPSFTVGVELFWGDDRLEEAIEWARTH